MKILRLAYDWWRMRHATESLNGLDDRALRDIGITREEIRHAVRYGRAEPQAADDRAPAGNGVAAGTYIKAASRRVSEAFPIRVTSILPASRN